MVAAAGKRGISREQVIGVLWEKAAEDQARHALAQTLYSMRRDAGRELIVGTTQLRLDPAISSDVGELETALAGGALDQAAELYSGRFLDGFYLSGAPEFERWTEVERNRIHLTAIRAIERLAGQTNEAGDRPKAVRLWHRLTELDPLSARYAGGYMRALAAADDRPGALAHARLYRETLRRELDAEPDPTISQLEASLRVASPDLQPPVRPSPRPLPKVEDQAVLSAPAVVSAPAPRGHSPRRWLIPAALGAVVLFGLVLSGIGRRSAAHLPYFAVAGIRTDPGGDSTRLGSVLRDMLATTLGSIEGLRVVTNSRLVELIPRGADTVPGALVDAARRAGATELIEGELSPEGTGFLFSMRRVALQSGTVRKGYVLRAADRFALVDSATAAIARDLRLTPPSVAVTEIRTSSPIAYAFYEEGLRAFYGYDGPAAYRLMKAALEHDSTFAMAAYYVWQLGRTLVDAHTTAGMARAKRLATRTIERERLLIQGSIAEVDAPLNQALAIAETLTVKYPDDPEGHILLGSIQERAGNWAAAAGAYGRAVALDSAAGTLRGPYCRVCTALYGMARLYNWWDSAAAAERTTRRLIALRPDEPKLWGNLVEALLRQGRRQEALAAWDKAFPEGPAASRTGLFYRDDIRWGRYEAVDRALREDAATGSHAARAEAWWLLLLSLRDQGRFREVDSVRQVSNAANLTPGDDPGGQPSDVLMIGMQMGRPKASIQSIRKDAERTARLNDLPGIRNRYLVWFLTLAGTVYAVAGDTAVLRRLADSVETLGQTSQFGRDAKLHYFLRGLLFQRQGRPADAADAFRRSLFSLTDGYTRANLMMARSLLELHRPVEAIAVLRPAIRGGVDGSNTYTSRTELHEALAQAFEQAGQADSARAHYAAVERAWRHADPQLRDRYLQAKRKAGIS